MKCLAFLLLTSLLISGPTAAQSIPIDIPDTPDESPMDREREKREERYRPFISRMYLTTSIAASPLLHRTGAVFDSFVEAGIHVGDDFSLFLVGGPRIAPAMLDERENSAGGDGGYAGALGAELRLDPAASWRVSVATGTWTGDAVMHFTELSPRYIYSLNPYWKLSLGVKATVVTFTEGGAFFFVGPSVGIRRSFGQRTQLE